MSEYKFTFRHSLFRIFYPLHHVARTSSRFSLIHDQVFTASAVSRRSFFTYTPRRLALERVEVAHSSYYRRSPTAIHSKASSIGSGKQGGNGNYGEDLTEKSVFRSFGGGNSLYSHLSNPPISRTSLLQPMRTLSHADAEYFFFRDDSDNDNNNEKGNYHSSSTRFTGGNHLPSSSSTPFCLLCREYVEQPFNKRSHIINSSRASHTNHTCREIPLDSLTLLAIRGYPIDSIYEVWSDALYQHEAFFRIKSLVSPLWSIERRAENLLHHLVYLKNHGVIDLSLAGVSPETSTNDEALFYTRRRIAFERLEYIGDNAWGSHISSRMMILFPDQQWQYSERSAAFNYFRDACEMNLMLEEMFDVLLLGRIHPCYAGARIGSGKLKADILESLIGELHVNVWGLEPQIYDDTPFVEVNNLQEGRFVALVNHCLTEIYDLIILHYSRSLSWNALPLAKELAVRHIWKRTIPSLQRHKMAARSETTRAVVKCIDFSSPVFTTTTSNGNDNSTASKDSEGSSKGVCVVPSAQVMSRINLKSMKNLSLPALPALFDSPRCYPRVVKHPLREIPLEELPQFTVIEHTQQDVFAYLHRSFERLGFLNEDAYQIFNRVPSVKWEKYIRHVVPHITTTTATCFQAPLRGKNEEHFSTSPEDPSFSVSPNDAEPPMINENLGMKSSSSMDSSVFHTAPIISSEGFSDVYFRDPYYNLFSSSRKVAEAHASHSLQPFRHHGSMRLPLVAIVKWTDIHAITKDDQTQHEKENVNIKKEDIMLSMTLSNAYPSLMSPSLIGSENGNFSNLSGGHLVSSQHISGTKPCLFCLSKYVPKGIKTPIGGVVMDKNLYLGQYAFLAYGKSNPMYPENELDASQKKYSIESDDKESPDVEHTELDTSKNLNDSMENSLSERHNSSLLDDAKLKQSSDESCKGNGNENSNNNDSSKEFSAVESARIYWFKWAKLQRQTKNSFF
ncbi:unnamed protein product [Phytomonas sp. Hart1]|nr:unnamed protein product [Phytomonas sp. Hart1]|eukprot:CCW66420.1 unnamed protein product [Phytomonas sp. isolate Hart1]